MTMHGLKASRFDAGQELNGCHCGCPDRLLQAGYYSVTILQAAQLLRSTLENCAPIVNRTSASGLGIGGFGPKIAHVIYEARLLPCWHINCISTASSNSGARARICLT